MDLYIEENFKIFQINFDSIPKLLELKLDKNLFHKIESELNKKLENNSAENFKKLLEPKADAEWVKKLLAKLNQSIKGLQN